MKYSQLLLDHFFQPKNVGYFDATDDVGTGIVGSYQNGAVVQLQIKSVDDVIVAACFKAYGSCPVIAACSYITEWLIQKSLEEACLLKSDLIIQALSIPMLKMHSALLVEDAVKAAILNLKSKMYNPSRSPD